MVSDSGLGEWALFGSGFWAVLSHAGADSCPGSWAYSLEHLSSSLTTTSNHCFSLQGKFSPIPLAALVSPSAVLILLMYSLMFGIFDG